jgi:glycosyltransferase involved in cell wall biosynthesis
MSRLRILVLAPDCNPDSVCGPLISYSQAAALAQLHDVTLLIRSPYERLVTRRGGPFRAIEVVRMPRIERIYSWTLRRIFKNNYRNQLWTAFGYPLSVAFEWFGWRQMRNRITAGEFDAVLRLLPITAVLPSPFAFFLRNGAIPFVIGPINGGLPWPEGFSQADNQKQWISGLRKAYRLLPFARSTYRRAAAIIAGSSHTYAEFAAYGDKLFFLPENGISESLCGAQRDKQVSGKLELIFVGGLVPYKACDLALRAAAPLLRGDFARFTIVGDGPERGRLEHLARELGIEKTVSFSGFLSHPQTMERLRSADVLLFPSVREFGGAVVFEALAAGVVPVVADFGGPGDIVRPEFGCKVTLTNENDLVSQMEKILADFAENQDHLEQLRKRGTEYARAYLTWDAKAQIITRIVEWAIRRGPKPDMPPPKMVSARQSRAAAAPAKIARA